MVQEIYFFEDRNSISLEINEIRELAYKFE